MNTNRFAAIRNRLNARVNAALNVAEQRIDSAVSIAETEIEQATVQMEERVTTATIAAVEQITAMGEEIAAGINGDGTFQGDTEPVEPATQEAFQVGDTLPKLTTVPVTVASNEAASARAMLG
ncbi:hypothetical protein DIE15_01960 [Burkholderia sp. Bp9031]|uniref:hypothetical protein n=1 Tax=Burkholderia sp. Bp9031 TaxID=2184566 RepID=UPI000F5E0E5E|nr:hypothetical protein [Burkholderia sp. Bp9031]RQZ20854.1 hypothetical protein DIE15_01960 [Burkholderia sp. Bp9031]